MTGRLLRTGLALMVSASMLTAPGFAAAQSQSQLPAQQQNQDQTQGQSQGQQPGQYQPPVAPSTDQTPAQLPPAASSAETDAARNLKVTFGHDYSGGPHAFPDITAPYRQIRIDPLVLTNTPRIQQLIQSGKLMLSLDDAITLAIENNLNINIARYTPWEAETDVLRSKSGQQIFGLPAIGASTDFANIPFLSFDPNFTSTLNVADVSFPVNNPFLAGTGTSGLLALKQHSTQMNFGYTEGFHTGTSVNVVWDNTRSSSTSSFNAFNPAVASNITVTVSQQLLNGFGTLPNTRFIVEAKNERQAADYYFAQQVITTITAVATAYWEYVFARENVKVEEAALGTSTKLYNDNKRQLEIGTMAPLDVLTAESEVATDRQNLILAQTTQLQQQTVLLNDITKQLMDPALLNVEIIPTTSLSAPADVNVAALTDAVREALTNRPDVKQAEVLLKNAGIQVKTTRDALLPVLTLFGQYESQGLGGNTTTTTSTPTAFAADLNAPLLTANGTPVLIGGQPVFAGTPSAFNTTSATTTAGFSDAMSGIFHNNFPTYAVGLNLTLPIRNRAAQADSARAMLLERASETSYLQLQNTVAVNVRNAQIALQQDRAQVDAAIKAGELAKQTLEAEQKKYQLGASTSYNVILKSRDLTAAQGNELRARINLVEAFINYDQALGRTLATNRITVADAQHGNIFHTPNIPGAFANVRLFEPGNYSYKGN
ncbi:MAG TPA: TolC family protein [Candidatus Acidoferrales bacterium]|nr:TolC family protein [Candidatus Acidoferrales bacterium]